METITEDQLEQETLGWLAATGYLHCCGLDMAPDGSAIEGKQGASYIPDVHSCEPNALLLML